MASFGAAHGTRYQVVLEDNRSSVAYWQSYELTSSRDAKADRWSTRDPDGVSLSGLGLIAAESIQSIRRHDVDHAVAVGISIFSCGYHAAVHGRSA